MLSMKERERNRKVLDNIVRYIDKYRIKTGGSDSDDNNSISDNKLFKLMAEKVAFQGARAKLVERLVNKSKHWKRAFANFDLIKATRLSSRKILKRYWDKFKVIRFKRKVKQIIKIAQVLLEIKDKYGSFYKYLESFQIPKEIRKEEDIEKFWQAVDKLRKDLREMGMPSFHRIPSLFHFLMNDMGYPCIKPDVVAMRIGYLTKIIPKPVGESNQRKLIMAVQYYCFDSKRHTPADVDGYLLCFGGQSATQNKMKKGFKACASDKECTIPECPMIKLKLCRLAK